MSDQMKRWALFSISLIVFMFLATSAQAMSILPGDAVVSQGPAIDWPVLGRWLLTWFVNFLIYFVFGLLALWLFPKPLYGWSERVRLSPWKSLSLGILGSIVGFTSLLLLFFIILALVIFLFTINLSGLAWTTFWLGMPAVSLATGIFYFIVAYLSKLVVAYSLGLFIFRAKERPGFVRSLTPLLLGLVIYLLIRAIPFLGWAVGVVVTLLGLGAVVSGWRIQPKITEETASDEAPVEPPLAASVSETSMLQAEGLAEAQSSEPVLIEQSSASN